MEEEEKNKETDQNKLSNKQSSENESSFNNNNNSKSFRQMNNQKIKIYKEKLKDSKEQEMEIKSELTASQNQNQTDITTKNNTLMLSAFNFSDNKNYYLKINRCLTARIKKIILIIFLILSLIFIIISIFDIINSSKKTEFFKNNKYLMNNLFIFIFQIAYALSLILFQGLILLLEKKENLIFNIMSIILISIIIIIRTILVIKKDYKNSTMVYNFILSFCLTFINLGIFMITLKLLKMKKNVQQNIEEIINFPDQATNSKIVDKKDNQLMLNNSGSEIKEENTNDKKVITTLVEETNIHNDNNNNENETNNKKE